MISKSIISVKSSLGNDIQSTLITQDPQSDSILVLFPGTNYNCNKPMLYYAKMAGIMCGCDVLCLEYSYFRTNISFNPQMAGDIIRESTEAVKMCFTKPYKNIYFISKSFGTLVAGDISKALGYDRVKNLFLTPLLGTISHISNSNCTVIVGTEDKFFFKEHINLISGFSSVNLKIVDGANHSLEAENDVIKNLDILQNISNEYLNFLGQ